MTIRNSCRIRSMHFESIIETSVASASDVNGGGKARHNAQLSIRNNLQTTAVVRRLTLLVALLISCTLIVVCALAPIKHCDAFGFGFDLNKMPDEQDDESEFMFTSSDNEHNRQLQTHDATNAIAHTGGAFNFNKQQQSDAGNSKQDSQDHVDPQLGRRASKRRKTSNRYGGGGGGDDDDDQAGGAGKTGLVSSLWSKVRALPRYFDFGVFKDKFKRKYSATEDFLRRSIFVQKCVSVFKSRVAFRLGQKSYLESVNQFSDRTPEEFALMFMAAPPEEFVTVNGSEQREELERDTKKKIGKRVEMLKRVNSDNYLPELQSQSTLNGNGGGSLLDESQAVQVLDKFYNLQELDLSAHGDQAHSSTLEQLEEALMQELNNFQVEQKSQSSLDSLSKAGNRGAGSGLPMPGTRKSSQDANAEDGLLLADESDLSSYKKSYSAPVLKAGESLDWSVHKCFHEVYNQGPSCGKCYVVAATALAEFYKCSEQEPGSSKIVFKRRKFSQTYVLNCAQKYTPKVMGCVGGSTLYTLKFIAQAGVRNIGGWRELRDTLIAEAKSKQYHLDHLDMSCPLNTNRHPLAEWGDIRVEMNPKVVLPNKWIEALQDGPLIASVQLPSKGMDTYESGVHDGSGCATSGMWHAMILVGYGTSDRGQTYWRFRNSFGPSWGEAGHFNLAMSVPGECLLGGVRVYREPLDT